MLAFAQDQLAWLNVQSQGQGRFAVFVRWKYTPAWVACPSCGLQPGSRFAVVGERVLWSRGNEAAGYSPACPPLTPGSTLCAADWVTPLAGAPTAVAGTGSSAVYVDDTGAVTVLDIATGALRWSADVEAAGVALADDQVLVGTTDDRLLAFPLAGCGSTTCTPAWEGMLGGAGSTPVVGGEVVYVGAGGDTQAFALDGCGAPVCAPLTTLTGVAPAIVDDGRVVGHAPGGRLVAFGLTS